MSTQNTLRTLRLPEYLDQFDGLIYKEFKVTPVLIETRDFTNPVRNPITGRNEPTITEKIVFEEKESILTLKQYALNWIDFRFNNNRFASIEEDFLNAVAKFEHGVQEVELEHGPKAGETVWYNGVSAKFIDFSNDEKHIEFRLTPGVNSINGVSTDKDNPLVTIARRRVIISGTVSINRRTGVRTVTNRKETIGDGGFPNIPLNRILELAGMSLEEYIQTVYTVFKIQKAPTPNHITATSIEAVFTPDGEDYIADAIVYYNGVSTDEKRPSGMITSYNKTYPGHVVRWRLYDGIVKDSIFGASEVIQFNSLQDDKIRIVAGNETSYNASTKTLTYNIEDGATIWCTFEEQPAQGKNWSNEAIYFLSEGMEPVRI
jgi:hypothetical protein